LLLWHYHTVYIKRMSSAAAEVAEAAVTEEAVVAVDVEAVVWAVDVEAVVWAVDVEAGMAAAGEVATTVVDTEDTRRYKEELTAVVGADGVGGGPITQIVIAVTMVAIVIMVLSDMTK
jgi:hypothetical protein